MMYRQKIMLRSSVIIGIVATALLMPNVINAFTSDNHLRDPFTEEERENGYALSSKSGRPSINPDFAPDESCLFDVYQLKCIPGAEQECPEGFGNNEDATVCHMNIGKDVLTAIMIENMMRQVSAIQIVADVNGVVI